MRPISAIVLLLTLAFAGASAAQPPAPPAMPDQPETPAPQQPPAPAPPSTSLTEEFAPRLATLSPQDPLAYFLLAEEVADRAREPADVQLAVTLYVLAFELDRRPGQPGTLAASAALGLSEITRLERDRRWLLAMAGALDKRFAQPDWNVPASLSISEETALKAATAIGYARSGDGRDARRFLEDPGTRDLLVRYDRAIGSSGETGALSRITKYASQWPCPECGNARVLTKLTEKGPDLRLCGTCRGNPGPRLSEEEFIAQLRFESYLLNGIQRSWAAQTMVDHGAPLRDPDPEDLAESMGVDPARPYFRDGKWIEKPQATAGP